MVNQTPISMRIDSALKWKIDQETMISGWTRNRILNRGAELWLEVIDAGRWFNAHGRNPEVATKVITRLVKTMCPWLRGIGKIEIEL